MTGQLRAAVVGLGKVAWKFDREPGRKVVWSHVGAYRSVSPRIELAGVCDPDPVARSEFSDRYPDVPLFEDARTMVAKTDPQIVSICTPPTSHRASVEDALNAPAVKVIWCEKPLAASLEDAEAIVRRCADRGVVLTVNHVRRWSPLWQEVRRMIAGGDVGGVRHIRIAMPNRLWSIGSHAVDLALMLGGPIEKAIALDVPALREDEEPARPALVMFESGAYGAIEVTGLKDRLVVEAEVIGDRGRLHAREDRGEIVIESFVPSAAYSGYLQLGPATNMQAATLSTVSPFVAVAEEILLLADDPSRRPACSGRDALETMRVLNSLAA